MAKKRRRHSAKFKFTVASAAAKGGRLSSRAISNVIAKFADRAGLDDVSPHTLRHSFAKNLVDADVGLEKVATLLGHESLETTRLYTQPSKADLQAATEKVAWQE